MLSDPLLWYEPLTPSINVRSRHDVPSPEIEAALLSTYSTGWLNTTLTVNERHPYRIVCEWFDPYNNIKKELKSENIFTDPQPIITSLGITKFNVYIDPKNTKNYYMDISELDIK